MKTAWIFDVDGVITSLFTRTVTQPHILDLLAQRLESNEFVALNTGRGLDWTIGRVIHPLLQKIKNRKNLVNFFTVGEKGGVWLNVNIDGVLKTYTDPALLIPPSLAEKIKVLGSKYWDKMIAYEPTKKTMFSFELKTGLHPETFKEIQRETVPQIENIIKEAGLDEEITVDPTRIGTDIQYKKVGKGFAMERILNWIKEKGNTPKKIITFGDSKSDFEMAKKAHEQGFQTEFVYVGGDDSFKNVKTEILITITKNKFEKGTLEFLDKDNSVM